MSCRLQGQEIGRIQGSIVMSIEISSKGWTGETGGLWSLSGFPRWYTPSRLWNRLVRAVIRHMEHRRNRNQPLYRLTCQYRVVKGEDQTQDVYCGKPVQMEHYFLCPDHFKETVKDVPLTDRWRYKRFPVSGWKAMLRRWLRLYGGWYWQWVERPNWAYWYCLKRAYTDNPARQFTKGLH